MMIERVMGQQVYRNEIRKYIVAVILAVVVVGLLASAAYALAGNKAEVSYRTLQFVQDIEPDVVAPPATLERLSWGAVLAGSIIAIMIQLALNLLGIAVGVSSIVPNYGDETNPKTLATGAMVWIGVSTLVALFAGGWLAGRFAGIPDQVDGLLHGLMVWGVVMLVSMFLLGTTLGRIFSGVAALLGQGMHLIGSATGAVARGVGTVAQGVGTAAAGVAQGAANVAQTAGANVADRVQAAASDVADRVRDAIEQQPEVANALRRQNVSTEGIMNEVRELLRSAGIAPEQVETQVRGAVQEVKWAAQDAVQNPAEAEHTIEQAIMRILQRGQDVTSQADRDAVIRVIMERGSMSEEQAQATLGRWEESANNARQELERARRDAEMRLRQARSDVEHKVEEVRSDVEHKVNEVRRDVEYAVHDAAEATTLAISRIAAALFAAIVIGGIAAGLGGLVGAPENIPSVEVTDTTTSFYSGGQT